MDTKLSVVIGNANMGHILKMCLYSFMKYNGQHIDEIIIPDNSSTDWSPQFYQENKYKDMTKVLMYDNLRDRTETLVWPHGQQWDLGLNNCKNEYALVTHADIEWRGDWVGKFLKEGYPQKPYLYGVGGGDDSASCCRIHEWGMIINVPIWKHLGVSFEGVWNPSDAPGESFDTGAYMFRRAYQKGYEIISVLRDGPSPDGKISNVVDDNEWFFHHIAGSRYRKNIITEYAKNYNEQNKG